MWIPFTSVKGSFVLEMLYIEKGAINKDQRQLFSRIIRFAHRHDKWSL